MIAFAIYAFAMWPLIYMMGHCKGWLKCSREQTLPMLEKWGETLDAWRASIEEMLDAWSDEEAP